MPNGLFCLSAILRFAMKIGIDCRMYGRAFTGIGRYAYELTENLFRIDDRNEYVLFFNEPEFSGFSTGKYHRVKKVLADARHYSLAEQVKFLKILYGQRLDLMHFTHFNAPLLYRRPCVVTIHDLTLSFFPGKKMNSFAYRFGYQMVMRSILKRAKKIIAVSEHTKSDLDYLFGVKPERVSVIYESVSEHFQKTDLPPDHPKGYLLYAGVWRDHKNLTGLLKSLALLRLNYGFDGKLYITGREDPHYPEVKRAVSDLDLDEYVVFTGLVDEDELVNLYNGAAVAVIPSLYEGFGLQVLEAFACGVPLACSGVSSLPEIAGPGNAVFFNPKDPRDMAEKIWRAYSDEALRHKLVLNGGKRVREFSWEKMAEETLKVYHSCL